MDIKLKRCIYCGNIYSYQASGQGCFEETNDDRYCPRCKKIINEALENNVSKDDIITHKPFQCNKFSNELLQEMDKLKMTINSNMIMVNCMLEYDIIEIYTINNKKYYICYNKGEEEKYYFIEKEYCKYSNIIKNDYIDYNRYSPNNSLNYGYNLTRVFKNLKIPERKLDKPKGDIFYDIPEWTIENNNRFYRWNEIDLSNEQKERIENTYKDYSEYIRQNFNK